MVCGINEGERKNILDKQKQYKEKQLMYQSNHIVQQMTKMDLHVHLNGAIPTPLVRDLLYRSGCKLPDGYNCENDLQVLSSVSSLRDYFRPWLALKLLPIGKDCLKEMMCGAVDHLYRDGVVYMEFRNSPFNIASINNITLEETIDWLAEAVTAAEEQFPVKVRLIISLSRYNFDLDMAYQLMVGIKKAHGRKFVVGVDLSGDENTQVPHDTCRFFRKAKDELGLSVTIHAGETGNYQNIEWAILDCGATRIGHGLSAVKSPKTTELIINRNICVEVCLQSNFRTGQIRCPDEHPISQFVALGIPFILCSDNPAVHGTTLSDDYNLFYKITARQDILEQMFERQKYFAFSGE